MPRLRLTFLGSGTSMGVPTIGCGCEVCRSPDPRDQRTRPSLLVRYDGHAVVIDTTPDFRFQALRAGLERLDAVLYTHGHADHILGMDDIRPFNIKQREEIPLYGDPTTLEILRRVFSYVLAPEPSSSTVPSVRMMEIDGPLNLFGVKFIPVPVWHGTMPVLGFRAGRMAYVTDFSEIAPESFALLDGLDVLILDALRYEPHPTHSTVVNSLALVERIRPKRAFFTHICHDLPHEATNARLPAHVRLAFDMLELETEA